MIIWKKLTNKTNEFVGFKCDTCGKIEYCQKYTLSISTDGESNEYHFDKIACLMQFLSGELRKDEPRDGRFIFGKE